MSKTNSQDFPHSAHLHIPLDSLSNLSLEVVILAREIGEQVVLCQMSKACVAEGEKYLYLNKYVIELKSEAIFKRVNFPKGSFIDDDSLWKRRITFFYHGDLNAIDK